MAVAAFLDGLDEATLSSSVTFPPPVQPSRKSRFEMLLGPKEHEMHHRGQLMLIQRLLGQVPADAPPPGDGGVGGGCRPLITSTAAPTPADAGGG